MKESDAKLKTCPKLFAAVTIAASNAVTNGASQEAVKELMTKGRCHGSSCVMWEPEYEEERHVQENGAPPRAVEPDKDYPWHKKEREPGATRVIWFRWVPTNDGDCGLKPVCNGCHATCG